MTKIDKTKKKTDTIEAMLIMLGEAYPEKFVITESLVMLYLEMFEEFQPETIAAASMHTVATRVNAWPPTIAELREACVNLELGRLHAPTAHEAWLEAYPYICGHKKNVRDLPSLTQRALLCAGGVEKLGQSTDLERGQRIFLRSYETLQESARQRRLTLPTVSKLVEHQRAILLQPHQSEIAEAPATKEITHD